MHWQAAVAASKNGIAYRVVQRHGHDYHYFRDREGRAWMNKDGYLFNPSIPNKYVEGFDDWKPDDPRR